MNEQWQKFVDAYVMNGGNGAAAAREAGYSDKPDSSKVQANSLLKRPEIQKAIFERVMQRAKDYAPAALAVCEKLAEGAQSEQIKLAAAKHILDVSGFKPSEKHEHTFKDERTDEELDATIRALQEELEARH